MLKESTISRLRESKSNSIVGVWDDGACVQKEDLGIITSCDVLFVMMKMDGYPVYFIREK